MMADSNALFLLLAAGAAGVAPAKVAFQYPTGAMTVTLCGAGDTARVVFIPTGSNGSFLR